MMTINVTLDVLLFMQHKKTQERIWVQTDHNFYFFPWSACSCTQYMYVNLSQETFFVIMFGMIQSENNLSSEKLGFFMFRSQLSYKLCEHTLYGGQKKCFVYLHHFSNPVVIAFVHPSRFRRQIGVSKVYIHM